MYAVGGAALSFLVIFLIWANAGDSVLSQTGRIEGESVGKKQETNKQAQDEVETLVTLLRSKEPISPETIVAAIEKLGSLGDERAIPVLIERIALERKFEKRAKQDPNVVDHWDSPILSARYPAIAALFQIGQPAVPGLIKLIGQHPISSLESKNALLTLHFIFRDDLHVAIKRLKDAMKRPITREIKNRFASAVESTRKECIRRASLDSGSRNRCR